MRHSHRFQQQLQRSAAGQHFQLFYRERSEPRVASERISPSERNECGIGGRKNARLKNELQKFDGHPPDTARHRLKFLEARVINNSTRNEKNFFTIDQGESSGVRPGMGIISPQGVVGKVKYSSSHFSVAVSLLNIDNQVSCMLKRSA